MENRVVELETKISYQEHLLQELNEVVITQQNQIDALEKSKIDVKEFSRKSEEFLPFALLGALFLIASLFMRVTLFRSIP